MTLRVQSDTAELVSGRDMLCWHHAMPWNGAGSAPLDHPAGGAMHLSDCKDQRKR